MATIKQEKIALLKRARAMVARSDYYYGVCLALSDECQTHSTQSTKAYMQLRAYVKKALENHTWLEGWQRTNRLTPTRAGTPAGRKARLQWIDWMIASLEGKI